MGLILEMSPDFILCLCLESILGWRTAEAPRRPAEAKLLESAGSDHKLTGEPEAHTETVFGETTAMNNIVNVNDNFI